MTEDEIERLLAFPYDAMPSTTTTAINAPEIPLLSMPPFWASVSPTRQQNVAQPPAPADGLYADLTSAHAAQLAAQTLTAPAPVLHRSSYDYAAGFQPNEQFLQSLAGGSGHHGVGMPNSGLTLMPPPLQQHQQHGITFGYGCIFCGALTPYVGAMAISWNFLEDARPSAEYNVRPRVSRTQSIQSSAATGEYFSDYGSEVSSKHSDDSRASYETPPSRISTPIVQHPTQVPDMTIGHQRASGLASFENMSPPTPNADDAQFIRFAIDQLTRDEDVLGRGRNSPLYENVSSTIPQLSPQVPYRPAPIAAPRPHTALSPAAPSFQAPRRLQQQTTSDETMLAIEPPEGQRWGDLGYKPRPLRPLWLGLFLLASLLFLAGLIFSNVYASRNHGLYDYDGFTTPIYFVFQYLPQLLGTSLILWLFSIEAAIYRSAPYLSMSDVRTQEYVLQDFCATPRNFLLPDLRWFRIREKWLGAAFMVFWITNFTIPLLSCMYQTQYVTDDGPVRWRWTASQAIGWTLVALYALLATAIASLLLRFWRAQSGLMWDPVSLADLFVLFSRSNVAQYFERTEVAEQVRPHIPAMSLMLGYWTTSRTPDVFYAVGGDNALLKRISVEANLTEKEPGSQDSSFDVERQRYSYDSAFTRSMHSPFTRYRRIPWFLRDIAVIAWIVSAAGLLTAFLVVSFVNRAVQDGFRPLLPSITSLDGFSSSNFLYSFLPSLLGMILFLLWQPIDVFFRSAQPYANLASPRGASAERSLLLSYQASYPLWVTVEAILNRDYKVALTSAVSVLSGLIPALAGGVFTAQLLQSGDVRMKASLPGYYALCVFLSIYAISFTVIWPKRKRYLPHAIDTIADQLSYLYASPLMSELWNVRTKPDLVARLVGTPAGLTGDWREKRPGARYAFGVYMGRDGKEHLGIDRLSRPGSGEMLVTTGVAR
ncbi:uncharacterized protein AB675_5735 [Cyphellophora attinorum]|uniref:Phosphoribosylaminoimidazole-succinocarboxamide synthase n=1 Tax=Cyphellophora attinorum TaxID=1664694 RepID=A0A0N1H2Q3_9EURO|nr:uncharacterized protein AB675_5735 [Phialophora attinorum]KPI38842.1 hypothetical protein AB675_5735 [Phialophora attinorum]